MSRKITTEYFINKSNLIHNYKYNYDKTVYIRAKVKVCITCPIHGDFFQTPNNHTSGFGCDKCARELQRSQKVKSLEQFKKDCMNIHGTTYNYDNVVYINNETKVCITCNIHGNFYQQPNNHLFGQGCPDCTQNGYNYASDGYLYIQSIDDGYNIISYKLGITNEPSTRLYRQNLNSNYNHKIIHLYKSDAIYIKNIESELKQLIQMNHLTYEDIGTRMD